MAGGAAEQDKLPRAVFEITAGHCAQWSFADLTPHPLLIPLLLLPSLFHNAQGLSQLSLKGPAARQSWFMGGEGIATEPESPLMALLPPSTAGIHPWHLQQGFILIQTCSIDGANQPRYKSPPHFPSPCPAAERERRGRGNGWCCVIALKEGRQELSKNQGDGTAPGKRGDLGMSFPRHSCHSHGISAGCRSPQCPSPVQPTCQSPVITGTKP